jgi:hypothetical protein
MVNNSVVTEESISITERDKEREAVSFHALQIPGSTLQTLCLGKVLLMFLKNLCLKKQ